ncbi:terminase small subunit [Chloroflexota bacterium]
MVSRSPIRRFNAYYLVREEYSNALIDMGKGQMRNKRGNPAWYRGMPSPNSKGRPRGQNSLTAYHHDRTLFIGRHHRWWLFCLHYTLDVRSRAQAARLAGYSPKSARYIAYRLWKKPVIRQIFIYYRQRFNLPVYIEYSVKVRKM